MWHVHVFFPGRDSQHPEAEEATRQTGVRLGLGQSQVRGSRKQPTVRPSMTSPAAVPLLNTDKDPWWTKRRSPQTLTPDSQTESQPTYTCFPASFSQAW